MSPLKMQTQNYRTVQNMWATVFKHQRFWLSTQDWHKIKPIKASGWMSSHPLAGELLVASGFQGERVSFPPGIWAPVGCTCSRGWLYTMCIQATLIGFSGLLREEKAEIIGRGYNGRD